MAAAPFSAGAEAEKPGEHRVAVIGHTGRGNYGHGLDTVWRRIRETEIVGVADANEAGLSKELDKLDLEPEQGFTDYREMLAKLEPEFVAVCPRYADQHRDMILAAIEAGARGIYVEKPLCRTPGEADAIREAARTHGIRIAVAHRNRYHPSLPVIQELVERGEIGQLLEIRGRGKGDRRGGAEDLWVLGSHVLNLATCFGGTPETCSAALLQDGRRVTAADVVEGPEGLGLLAGNEVRARYRLKGGVTAYFDSIANDGTRNAGFGLQLIGSEGILSLRCDRNPLAHLVPGNPFLPTNRSRPWIPVTPAGLGKEATPAQEKELTDVRQHVLPVRDLIAACEEGREPLCGLDEGALTVEMICGTFVSHRERSRAVRFPLAHRGNALADWA